MVERSSSPPLAPTLPATSAKSAKSQASPSAKASEEAPIVGFSPHSQTERPEDWPERSAIWLLDGFNILHAALFSEHDRASWWAEEHRERLISIVRDFADTANEIWIAFDGKRDCEPDSRRLRTSGGVPVYIVFAASADDWLVRQVRSSKTPETISVVTRDRQVGGRVRHKGASVVAPRLFLDLCQSP